MSDMTISIRGSVPGTPKEQVIAVEAFVKAICQQSGKDPADVVMVLMTAAAHIATAHVDARTYSASTVLTAAVPHAVAAAKGFFSPQPKSEASA